MSVCDGSDNEDVEVKQEPMDSDKVKSEESPLGVESGDPSSDSQDVLSDTCDVKLQQAQVQVSCNGKHSTFVLIYVAYTACWA